MRGTRPTGAEDRSYSHRESGRFRPHLNINFILGSGPQLPLLRKEGAGLHCRLSALMISVVRDRTVGPPGPKPMLAKVNVSPLGHR